MTISVGGNRGAGSSKAAGDTVSPSFNAAVAVGKDILVAALIVPPVDSVDPVTKDPDGLFILGLLASASLESVTDSKSNAYSILEQYYFTKEVDPSGEGPLGDTYGGVPIVALAIAKARVTTALTTSDHFTANWAGTGARVAAACEVTVGADKQLALAKGGIGQYHPFGGTDPNATIAGLTGSKLLLGLDAIAGPSSDGFTADTDYTPISAPGTTGGAAESNGTLRWARRVASVASDTYQPLLGSARDGLAALLAFAEV